MPKLHLADEIFELIYPINSIYISEQDINPSILFGGTWEKIDESPTKFKGTNIDINYNSSWIKNIKLTLNPGLYLVFGNISVYYTDFLTIRFTGTPNGGMIRSTMAGNGRLDSNLYSGELVDVVHLTQTTDIYLESWSPTVGVFTALELYAYRLDSISNRYFKYKRIE